MNRRRRIALAAVFASALATPRASHAQGDTVTVERRVLVAPDVTPADARRRAVDEALGEAVRRVAGVRVRSSAVSILDERNPARNDGYWSVVQLDAAARAVDYRVVDEGWVTLRLPDVGEQLYFRAQVHVTVERERGAPDPGFTAEVALDAARYAARGPEPGDRDELRATVHVSRASHLYAFIVADDTAERLIPNDYVRSLPAAADAAIALPPDEWRARGVRFRASLPAGRTTVHALFMVVATLDELPPPPPSTTVLQLQRWLVRIPADRRAIAFAPYDVTR